MNIRTIFNAVRGKPEPRISSLAGEPNSGTVFAGPPAPQNLGPELTAATAALKARYPDPQPAAQPAPKDEFDLIAQDYPPHETFIPHAQFLAEMAAAFGEPLILKSDAKELA